MTGLAVLAVDDEPPSLDELIYLLSGCAVVARTAAATNATDALRIMQEELFDLVLLDVRMPGLNGLELAKVLDRFAHPPAVAFVTAHEEHALAAFEVGACGYLLKPVTEQRLTALLERVVPVSASDGEEAGLDVIAVEIGPTTRLVPRDEVVWVESAGDYVRLHTVSGGNHLVRLPMVALETKWLEHGFVRVHRSYLVDSKRISELFTDGARTTVRVGGAELPVSRRHAADLRSRLMGGTQRHLR